MSETEVINSDKTDGCIISKEISKTTDHNHNHEIPPNEGQQKPSEKNDQGENENDEAEPIFTAKVNLPLIDTKTMEDDEDIVVELRARIYRYDDTEDPPEFKERGTGNVKILRHKITKMSRILMRRDKTLKICANHYITGSMKLGNHGNSGKVFIYATMADFYENQTNPETFAIRFANPENAALFKNAFDESVKISESKIMNQDNEEGEAYDRSQDSDSGENHKSVDEEETSKLASDMEKIKLDNEKKEAEKEN